MLLRYHTNVRSDVTDVTPFRFLMNDHIFWLFCPAFVQLSAGEVSPLQSHFVSFFFENMQMTNAIAVGRLGKVRRNDQYFGTFHTFFWVAQRKRQNGQRLKSRLCSWRPGRIMQTTTLKRNLLGQNKWAYDELRHRRYLSKPSLTVKNLEI